MSNSINNDTLDKYNDFENICNKTPKNTNGLTDFLKITTSDGSSDVYDGNGHRLSFKNKKEMFDEMCDRT